MNQNPVLHSLDSTSNYIIRNVYYLQFIQGLCVILIGSILPMLQEEYHFSYQMGGFLISAHSIGNITAGLLASIIPIYIGMKGSLVVLNSFAYVGYALMLFTGNIWFLLLAFTFTGVGRGAILNYSNVLVNNLTDSNSVPLNTAHAFFAVGAFVSPILVLVLTKYSDVGWKYAIVCLIVLGISSVVFCMGMKIDDAAFDSPIINNEAFGFIRKKNFWIAVGIVFCYISMESSVIGWVTTYFIETGVTGKNNAQLFTSMIWLALLIGRFGCARLAYKYSGVIILNTLSIGIFLFLTLLILSRNAIFMVISAFGLGLSFSGVYASAISGIGGIIKKYPLSMGFFLVITGLGSIAVPFIVGSLADYYDVRKGLSILVILAMFQLILSGYNFAINKNLDKR